MATEEEGGAGGWGVSSFSSCSSFVLWGIFLFEWEKYVFRGLTSLGSTELSLEPGPSQTKVRTDQQQFFGTQPETIAGTNQTETEPMQDCDQTKTPKRSGWDPDPDPDLDPDWDQTRLVWVGTKQKTKNLCPDHRIHKHFVSESWWNKWSYKLLSDWLLHQLTWMFSHSFFFFVLFIFSVSSFLTRPFLPLFVLQVFFFSCCTFMSSIVYLFSCFYHHYLFVFEVFLLFLIFSPRFSCLV